MYQVIIVVHVFLGLGVIGLVLMQQGKGADAGAAFGTGSSGTVFGAQGAASFLSRSTAILATLFFTTSLGLAVLSGNQGGNVINDLMSTQPAVDKDTLGIPDVDGAKNIESVPPAPATEPETMPAAEQAPAKVTATEQKANTEPKAAQNQKSPAKAPVAK